MTLYIDELVNWQFTLTGIYERLEDVKDEMRDRPDAREMWKMLTVAELKLSDVLAELERELEP